MAFFEENNGKMDLHSNNLRIEKLMKNALVQRITGQPNWLDKLSAAFKADRSNKILVTLWQRKAEHLKAPQEVKLLVFDNF